MSAWNPPRIYAEWLPLLERFREGDDGALDSMRRGAIEWTNVVAERWTARVAETLSVRLQVVSRELQIGLDRSRGDLFAISKAMIGARRSLIPLRALASLSCTPEGVRKHLVSELERFIRQTQETLEKGAQEIRRDNGLVLKAIRDNPLTAMACSDVSEMGSSSESPERAVTRGRRVIL
jgi:hypothetical protein